MKQSNSKGAIRTIWNKVKSLKEFTISLIIIILVIVVSIKAPVFLSASNIRTTTLGLSTTGIIAIGVTIALIGGCFDLSVGSIMGLSSVLVVFLSKLGINIWITVLLSFGISLLFGLANGLMVGKVKLNGFITTFGMSQIARGIVFILTEGYSVRLPEGSESFQKIGNTTILGVIPAIVAIFLVLTLIGDFLLRKSSPLMKVFYVGSNEKAAILSGINSGNVKVAIYVGTAGFASLAGILAVSRFGVATATTGQGIEMTVISAAVIGGASLAGGKGTVIGSVLGVIMLSILNNALVLFNISVHWQSLVSGVVLILAIVIDYISNRSKRNLFNV